MKVFAIILLAIGLSACSDTPDKDDNGSPNNTSPNNSMANNEPERDAGESDDMGGGGDDPTCEDLAYKASGAMCGTCSLSCDCEEGFPLSVASCTDDGCIVAADCPTMCAGGLEFAVGCTDVYTVCAAGECD